MPGGWQVVRSPAIVGLNAYQAPERLQDSALPLPNMHNESEQVNQLARD